MASAIESQRSCLLRRFPGCERIEIKPLEHSFGLRSGIVPLTVFTDHQVECRFDRRYRVGVRGLGLPPVGYDLGGVSGGPMLQPIYQDGVWGWRLVGVVSEAIMMEEFDRITAAVLADRRRATRVFEWISPKPQ